MVSNRCKMAVKAELKKLGLHFIVVDLGEVEIMENISAEQREQLRLALLTSGLQLIDDHKAVLIEKIRTIIVEMVYKPEEKIKMNFSDYLTEKLKYDYTYLANLFSEVQGITIEQFMIRHKIEMVKELMTYEELSITEIAWKMNYSSVSHLSNQFKKVTGFSPSHFNHIKDKRRSPIEEIGKQPGEHIAVSLPDTSAISMLETKKTEDSQYARSLIEASLDPLVTISAEGKITDMNEATVNITGVTREFLTGTDFFNYFTEPHKAREVYKEVFAKGSVADSPLTLRHIDGKLTDVLFNGSIYKDNRGTVQGVVIVARDVTEQKRIATELTEAIVSAEKAI
jgi:PAS domain S-box-containing protein